MLNAQAKSYWDIEPYLPEVVKCYTGIVQFYCYDLVEKNINNTFVGYNLWKDQST